MIKLITECSLAELVADPLVGLMMKSDGVDRRSVERLFDDVARGRAQEPHDGQSRSPKRETAL